MKVSKIQLQDFEILAQNHGFTLGRSINISDSFDSDESEELTIDLFIDISDRFGVYLFSVAGRRYINEELIDELIASYRLNNPISALWQYIESERENGRGVYPDDIVMIQHRLKSAHRMFWELICDLYLSIAPTLQEKLFIS